MSFEIGYKSPIGWITITAGEDSIERASFSGSRPSGVQTDLHEKTSELIREIFFELNLYFQGRLQKFNLRLSPQGTAFQQSVWDEISKISYGETISYEALAHRLGDEKKTRAVAQANAKNPIAILIPCHRVVGKNGQLTGYAWGLARKRYLLNLEKGTLPSQLF